MHILDTALYKSPKVLMRRICLPVKSFFGWWVGDHFLYSYDLNIRFRYDIVGRSLMLVALRVFKFSLVGGLVIISFILMTLT